MARTGRPKAELVSDDERDQLQRWARRARSAQALALRSRIVLACGDGESNIVVAARLGCSATSRRGRAPPGTTRWCQYYCTRACARPRYVASIANT
jgi:hypothetical protein